MIIKDFVKEKGVFKGVNLNIVLFCIGKFISVFGTAIYTFAMGIYILRITGSAIGFATNLILSTIPMLIIAPFGGVLADRVNKKKLVVAMDFVNGLFLIIIYFIAKTKGLSIPIIYLSTIVITSLTTIFDLSIESSKPDLVSESKIVTINSVSKIIDSLSSVLGPVIGGVVFSLINIKVFILINGVSFIISAIIEGVMDFNYNKKEVLIIEKATYLSEFKEGIRYILSKKNITKLLSIFILYNIFISFSITIPLPYILNNILEVTPTSYGIVEGALPIGMIIGSLFVKKIMAKINSEKIFLVTGIVLSILMCIMSTPIILLKFNINSEVYIVMFLSIIFTLGICFAVVDVPFLCIMQTEIEEKYRARSLSVVICMIKICVPISFAFSGFCIELINPFFICLIGGIITFVGSIIFKKHI